MSNGTAAHHTVSRGKTLVLKLILLLIPDFHELAKNADVDEEERVESWSWIYSLFIIYVNKVIPSFVVRWNLIMIRSALRHLILCKPSSSIYLVELPIQQSEFTVSPPLFRLRTGLCPSDPIDFPLVQAPPESRTLQRLVTWALTSPHALLEWNESSKISLASFCWQMDLPFMNNPIWLYWSQMESCCVVKAQAENIGVRVHTNLCVSFVRGDDK